MVGHPAPRLRCPSRVPGMPKRNPQRVGVIEQCSPVKLTWVRFYSRPCAGSRGGPLADREVFDAASTGVTKINTAYPSEVVERAQAVDVCCYH